MKPIDEKIKTIARSMITASHANQLDDKTFEAYLREILEAQLASTTDEKMVEKFELWFYENVYNDCDDEGEIVDWDAACDWTQKQCHNSAVAVLSQLNINAQKELVVKRIIDFIDSNSLYAGNISIPKKDWQEFKKQALKEVSDNGK
jgi:hypothetical protein